jgi:hypothetical protein
MCSRQQGITLVVLWQQNCVLVSPIELRVASGCALQEVVVSYY